MAKIFALKKEKYHINIFFLGIKIKFRCTPINNNKVYIIKNGKKKLFKGRIKGLKIIFKGVNNTIEIEKPFNFKNSKIFCGGENNVIKFEQSRYANDNLYIHLSGYVKQSLIHIKKNFSSGGARLNCWRNNSKIIIGEDCMFSWGVSINSSDAHTITSKNSSEPINNGYFCEIGDHVWLAQNVVVCKNVKIPENCVIGASSVVTKNFKESNVILAGNPAKIVKREIDWTRDFN